MTAPIWGLPWHGLYSSGTLKLKNDDLITYPNAATSSIGGSNSVLGERYGSTVRVRRPGWQDPARSPEDLVSDALAGKDWRGEAMLSGASMMLGGKYLNGWIYFCTDGSRWLIQYEQATVNTTTASIRLLMRPFGRIGEPDEPVQETVSVNPGQSMPGFTGIAAYWAGVRTVTDSAAEPLMALRLWDAASDGSRVAFQISMSRPRFAPSYNPQLAVGWLEVLVTGGSATEAPSPELTVMYSRAQTLATVTDTEDVTVARIYLVTEIVREPDPDPPAFALAEFAQYPDKVFYKSTSTNHLEEATSSISSSSANGYLLRGSRTAAFSPRVVSVWYDTDGLPQPVTVSADLTLTLGAETEFRSGGSVVTLSVDRFNDGSIIPYQTTNTVEPDVADIVQDFVETLEIRLTGPNGEIAKTAQLEGSWSMTATRDGFGGSGNARWLYTSHGGDWSCDFDGAAYAGPQPAYASMSGIMDTYTTSRLASFLDLPSAALPFASCWLDRPGWYPSASGDWAPGNPYSGMTLQPWQNLGGTPPFRWYAVGAFMRASITPTMQGWLNLSGPNTGSGLAAVTIKHSAILTPTGMDSREWSGPTSFGGEAWALHGSRDPMTGECARFHSVQVCYV